jgi:hypothetical protein
MKKSAVQEKSRGVLLFAFDTKINYVEIARRSAQLIRRTLDLPVALVTDTPVRSSEFNQVIVVDNTLNNHKVGQPGAWRNGDRYRAYELSPWDETLLIDSDYLMLDSNLLKLFEQDFDYRIMSYNQTPAGEWKTSMGNCSIPYLWATAILFRRTEKTRMLFELVGRIQRNYLYYLKLYHGNHNSFRNDYAFTIANNILNGYDLSMDQGIAWPMFTFNEIVKSISIKNNLITVKEKNKAHIIPRQNIHVMDKEYLLSDNFANFVEQICNE